MRPGRGLVFGVGGFDRRPDPTCQTDLCRQTLLMTPMPYSTIQNRSRAALARVRLRTLSRWKEGRGAMTAVTAQLLLVQEIAREIQTADGDTIGSICSIALQVLREEGNTGGFAMPTATPPRPYAEPSALGEARRCMASMRGEEGKPSPTKSTQQTSRSSGGFWNAERQRYLSPCRQALSKAKCRQPGRNSTKQPAW